MDQTIIKSLLIVIVGYFLGSISFAYVVGRLVRGIDMTEVGNGRIGTAFAIRQLGWKWGMLVGVMDFFKGVGAIALALALDVSTTAVILAGMAAVAGHNWSVFLRFKGGRGAATSFGVLAALAPLASLITVVVLAGPFLWTRRSSIVWGVRRTTLLYSLFLAVVLLIMWADISLNLMPAPPWIPETSFLLLALPPGLLALNLAGSPQARRGFDNQTRLG
jgi:acyl phosphate:glycerol-3-phosphate acyltransferase